MNTGTQDDNFSINKRKKADSSDKLDPIIAVLAEYVRAVEKYQTNGDHEVTQHHMDNITFLKNWDGKLLH